MNGKCVTAYHTCRSRETSTIKVASGTVHQQLHVQQEFVGHACVALPMSMHACVYIYAHIYCTSSHPSQVWHTHVLAVVKPWA